MTAAARRRSRRGRVLFLSHAAERTGPPIILLHLARWLRAHTDLDFGLLFLQGGELEEEFRTLAPVWILDEWDPPRPAVVLDSLAWKFGLERHAPRIRAAALRWRMRSVRGFDVVYVNTCGSVRPLRYLRLDDPVVLTHVHELSVGLDFHLPPEDRELIREVTRHYVVVSDAVAAETERVFGATPDQITRQYGFVALPPETAPPGETAALRASLGIPEEFTHPTFLDAIATVAKACRKHDKALGRLVPDVPTGLDYWSKGFDFLCYSGDVWLLQAAIKVGVDGLREACRGPAPKAKKK